MCRFARTDQYATGQQDIAGLRLLDLNGAGFIQTAGKHVGKAIGHVLHHHDGAGKIRRQLRENILQSVRSSGRNADGNDPGRNFGGERGFLPRPRRRAHR